MVLQDLGELVEKTKNAVQTEFSYEDVSLSKGFRDAFAKNISSGGNTIKKNEKNGKMTYKDKYSSYGYSIQKNRDYENASGFFEKQFDILIVYPALEEYTNRLFCFGKLPLNMEEDSEPEPDYLDRTWLLHGRCCRETTKVDCVQLLNALDVCEFIFGKFNDSLFEDISDKNVITAET